MPLLLLMNSHALLSTISHLSTCISLLLLIITFTRLACSVFLYIFFYILDLFYSGVFISIILLILPSDHVWKCTHAVQYTKMYSLCRAKGLLYQSVCQPHKTHKRHTDTDRCSFKTQSGWLCHTTVFPPSQLSTLSAQIGTLPFICIFNSSYHFTSAPTNFYKHYQMLSISKPITCRWSE